MKCRKCQKCRIELICTTPGTSGTCRKCWKGCRKGCRKCWNGFWKPEVRPEVLEVIISESFRHSRHSRRDVHPLGGWVVYGAAVTERSRGHPNIMQHIHISLILEIAMCSQLAAFLSGQAFWGQKKLAFWRDPPAPKCRQQTLRMCLIIFQINSTRCVW